MGTYLPAEGKKKRIQQRNEESIGERERLMERKLVHKRNKRDSRKKTKRHDMGSNEDSAKQTQNNSGSKQEQLSPTRA